MTQGDKSSTQRTAFYFAAINFLSLACWIWVRLYFRLIGDPKGDRDFVFQSMMFFPFWVLSWLIGVVLAAKCLAKTRRLNWYGIAAVAMLAVPSIPAIFLILMNWYRFLVS